MGDSGPALEGLMKIYNNPQQYEVLPYRHRCTPSGDTVITGFFLPAYELVQEKGYIDNRGYTDPELGKEFYDKKRSRLIDDPKALMIYSAEYCYTAEEAFALEGDNKFNKLNIAEQITRIKVLK